MTGPDFQHFSKDLINEAICNYTLIRVGWVDVWRISFYTNFDEHDFGAEGRRGVGKQRSENGKFHAEE